MSYTPPVAPDEQPDPNAREAMNVAPHEAALLAAMISSPSMYDPVQHPQATTARRNLVLQRMLDMHTITQGQYDAALRQSLPSEDDINPPKIESQQPYFTSWMTEHLLQHYRAGKVFAGGLKVRTTLDPELQDAAERAIVGRLGGIGPDAALVAIQNGTGEVRAMVGGSDFNTRPFNLATNGHRQPGSAIKPFILARALDDGVDPNSVWASGPVSLPFVNGHGQKGKFDVSNYDDAYYGSSSLWSATEHSDNSVFAQVGMKVGRKRVARLAQRMGIRTKLSTNPAMLLGGLKEGVTPLEMAYAYSTIANDGKRISGSMAPEERGPVAIQSVEDGDGHVTENEHVEKQVLPPQGRAGGEGHAAPGRERGHRQGRAGGHRGHLGQDRDDRELRRRLVRGRQRRHDGRHLGRLRRQAPADGVRARRRACRGRHLPGGDLPRLHDVLAPAPPGAPPRARGEQAGGRHRDRRGARPAGGADRSAAGHDHPGRRRTPAGPRRATAAAGPAAVAARTRHRRRTSSPPSRRPRPRSRRRPRPPAAMAAA